MFPIPIIVDICFFFVFIILEFATTHVTAEVATNAVLNDMCCVCLDVLLPRKLRFCGGEYLLFALLGESSVGVTPIYSLLQGVVLWQVIF